MFYAYPSDARMPRYTFSEASAVWKMGPDDQSVPSQKVTKILPSLAARAGAVRLRVGSSRYHVQLRFETINDAAECRSCVHSHFCIGIQPTA